MRQADLSRQKNQTLSDLEVEARDRAQYLLERANAMRMEQEDEVKKLNEVQHVPHLPYCTAALSRQMLHFSGIKRQQWIAIVRGIVLGWQLVNACGITVKHVKIPCDHDEA